MARPGPGKGCLQTDSSSTDDEGHIEAEKGMEEAREVNLIRGRFPAP
jgi:hypothetical protein